MHMRSKKVQFHISSWFNQLVFIFCFDVLQFFLNEKKNVFFNIFQKTYNWFCQIVNYGYYWALKYLLLIFFNYKSCKYKLYLKRNCSSNISNSIKNIAFLVFVFDFIYCKVFFVEIYSFQITQPLWRVYFETLGILYLKYIP